MPKCEMIVGHRCNDEGDITGDIECINEGVDFFDDTWHCADCVAYFEKHDPELLAAARRGPPPASEPTARPKCTNHAPRDHAGHWRDWHRGHGCDLDPTPPAPEPPAEPELIQWLTYPIGDRQLSAHAFVGDAQHSVCGKLSRQRCRAQRADRRCKLCTYSLSQRAAAWKVGGEERTDG